MSELTRTTVRSILLAFSLAAIVGGLVLAGAGAVPSLVVGAFVLAVVKVDDHVNGPRLRAARLARV